jgi:ABC-type multidrug transport system ATPase subunit
MRRVNFASAYAGLPRDLSLRENLSVFSDLYEVPDPAPRIERLIRELDLGELANRPTMQLSAGQRMRAVLAKALLSEPELLLLDEPTASLDPETAAMIREYLVGLARTGVTLLWASHNMVEIERYATRVVFLHSGRVVMDGPPRELTERAGRVVVRFKPSGPLPGSLLARLNGQLRVDQDDWLETEARDTASAAELVAEVQTASRLVGLEIRQPTLEDLFLQLAREGRAPGEAGLRAAEAVS